MSTTTLRTYANVDVATVTLLLGFKGKRAGRSRFHDAPYQPQADSIARPASAMTGQGTRMLFAGPDAYARAKAAFDSIASGVAHKFVQFTDNNLVYNAWGWMLAGDITLELDEQTRKVWIVTFDWRAIS